MSGKWVDSIFLFFFDRTIELLVIILLVSFLSQIRCYCRCCCYFDISVDNFVGQLYPPSQTKQDLHRITPELTNITDLLLQYKNVIFKNKQLYWIDLLKETRPYPCIQHPVRRPSSYTPPLWCCGVVVAQREHRLFCSCCL